MGFHYLLYPLCGLLGGYIDLAFALSVGPNAQRYLVNTHWVHRLGQLYNTFQSEFPQE